MFVARELKRLSMAGLDDKDNEKCPTDVTVETVSFLL